MNLKEAIEDGIRSDVEFRPGPYEAILTPANSWYLGDGRIFPDPVAFNIPTVEISVGAEGYDPAEAAGVNAEAVGPFAAGTLRIAYVLPERVVLSYRPVPWNHVFAHGSFQRITNGFGHPLYPEIDFAALGPDAEPPVEVEEPEAPPEDPDAGDEAPADPEADPGAGATEPAA